ncbi:hypothetical protein F511_39566 [Dorcoceras hygrometricum]|uniref:Uncharacterized protein n=1 Tax=Dorcoceras hygrometricum TaxID=472368 RepID=A0A2Z7BG09_9LAMI|nr:hypothetical protein F511_39566 [Dorcoceras hygrometricum]
MFLVDWAVKTRIRPPEFETSNCDTKYHVSLEGFTRRFDVCRPSTNTQSPSLAQGELLATPQTITQTQLLALQHLE